MRYGSVCSGIEAATVAWHPLDWRPAFFAEIEAFPSAVLTHHYPDVPNLGDMTKFKDWPDADLDVLVGGTPCQSFSVAGLRKGLVDPRGNLALTFLALADRYRPEWVIWENVPGVLSIDGGRAFGSILGGLAELRYGWAYRVLDAQYVRVDGYGRAVPQRRRRVFVVGNSRSFARAAAVLFEPESLSWNPAPRREAGQGVAGAIARSSFSGGGAGGRPEGAAAGHFVDVAQTIPARSSAGGGLGTDFDLDGGLVETPVAFGGNNCSGSVEVAAALGAHAGPAGRLDFASETFIAFDSKASGRNGFGVGEVAPTLRAMNSAESNPNAGGGGQVAYAQAVTTQGGAPSARGGDDIATGWAVRRLTPRECERLQGFPDDYTLIEVRGKPAADGPRYKALGNSMACNVMRWIGHRIAMVQEIADSQSRSAA